MCRVKAILIGCFLFGAYALVSEMDYQGCRCPRNIRQGAPQLGGAQLHPDHAQHARRDRGARWPHPCARFENAGHGGRRCWCLLTRVRNEPPLSRNARHRPTTLVVGISLPARWAHGIKRAPELLRAVSRMHPKADDAEIMRMMLINGMVAVIDGANSGVMWEERKRR